MSSLLNFFNNQSANAQVEQPELSVLPLGRTIFRVCISAYKCVADVTRDMFSPWTRAEKGARTSTKTETIKVKRVNGVFIELEDKKDPDHLLLKVIRNKHRDLELKREIRYIMNKESQIVTDIIMIYDLEEDTSAYRPKKARVLSSVSQVVKNAADGRPINEVARIVSHLDMQRTQIISLTRNVETALKSGRGKAKPSDVNKLIDHFAHSSKMEDVQGIHMQKNGMGIQFRQIVGYTLAMKHFAECLPTIGDVAEHKRWVQMLVESSKSERKEQLERLLASLPPSGSIANVGTAMMFDTTFSLSSGEYVTLALGVSEMFINKHSKKNATILLAVMIHSTKEMENHEAFAKYLNERFTEYAKGKTLACICHDGESAFSAYNTGTFLKDATLIRCDVHRLENFKHSFASDDASLKDELVKKLFGRKEETEMGTVLKKGALNVLTQEEFDKKFEKLYRKCPSGPQKWLSKNRNELFSTNSLLSKLLAGQTQQFYSTNLLEAKNAALKVLVPRVLPAHLLLKKFLSHHEDEVKDRISAIRGLSDKLITHFTVEESDWNSKSNYERTIVLRGYGLQDYYFDNALINYPEWIGEPLSGTRDVYMMMVQQLEIHTSSTNQKLHFAMDPAGNASSIREKEDKLECLHSECRKVKGYKKSFCKHTLALFISMKDENKKKRMVARLERIRAKRTAREKQAEQLKPSDGKKKRRRGKNRSRINDSKRYYSLVSTESSSSSDSSSEDSSSDSDETGDSERFYVADE